jgi:hypothetical protein
MLLLPQLVQHHQCVNLVVVRPTSLCHHLSHSEIAGDKRTSKPCSFSESTAAILGQCGHSGGTEDSLHCGTEDEIVLPVLFITGAAQSGSELRPMPRPVQERVRKAFAAAGLNVCRGHRK